MMNSQSRTLNLNDVRPGMSLAEDIADARGTILLPRGTLISEAAILSLRYWGVERVAVADQGRADDPPARRQRVQARLDSLFRKCRGPQASEALLQSVRLYRLGMPQ